METLSLEQSNAAHSDAPNVIIIASPGSGKTKTLVEAVVAKAKINGPQSVICITFTNAGADEMRKRLYDHPSASFGTAKFGYIGTLHAFLLRELRRQFRLIGLPCPPTVIDDDAAELLLESIIESMGARTSAKKIAPLLKNHRLIEPVKIGNSYTAQELVAVEYHRRLRAAGLVDLDGLLYYGEKLIKFHKGEGGATFEFLHLFVDEAQDSADADFRIYEAMPCLTKFYVGDTDQAIYGFRGGNVHNLVNMASRPEHDIHVLQTNYRCQKAICQTANALIEQNIHRIGKQTIPHEDGGTVKTLACDDPTAEQFTISGWARIQMQSKPKGIAVLCRTNRLAQEIAGHLKTLGLPVATPTRRQDPPDWREAKLLLAAIANPHADLAWYKIAELVDGKPVAERAKTNASLNMTTVRQELAKLDRKWTGTDVDSLSRVLSLEARNRIQTAMAELEAGSDGCGYGLPELIAYIQSGETQEVYSAEAIFVGTVHGAKGREWDSVLIAGCEDGSFPQAKKDSDLEEERRLMFVAITRARKTLAFTWCKERPQSRGPNLPPGPMQPKEPSRFLAEMGQKNC